MRKSPSTWELTRLLNYCYSGGCQAGDGKTYVPARPEGFSSIGTRVQAAWLVFTGKADALLWPGQ